ncbi:hypothetical protein Q5P01_014419 [Channa striata]|uniref:CRAL-TRIO domain-containing protein n=1 Tax=Channa striata TaxID=64152 RepID=A0AA88MJS1_CHASR|nr:hypothetical protein Q5P01_014419 [Channa striata]
MDEYLRKVQSRVGADASEDPVHAVLGGPEPDVDTVAATLCLALHLSQKEKTGGVCVPVLRSRRSDPVLPTETVRYLQSVKISAKLLLWKEDVDFLKLHRAGKLTLTLLRDGLLESSEYPTLESSILRVVHHDGQQDAGDDGASSAVTTVTREILQEAAEHIRASLGETLGEALRLQSEALWTKHGHQSAQLEELKRSLEQWSHVTAGAYDEAKLKHLEQLLTMELKEFSDGEMTLALSSVTTDKEDLHGYVDGLKFFSHQHGYDGLVVLLSINDSVHHPRQQMVIYSNNTNVLNQICSELEESSSWSLSGELETRESLQVYHIPINTSSSILTPPLLEEEIQGFLKDFVERRNTILACHPSSRTSSTEGVAGSVEFSQGSSGINDMDGSDIERAEGGSGEAVAIARVMADGEEDTGGVGVSTGGELVSPDSGMTTIRSSRSSKESSVFLSDDSPVGDFLAGAGQAGGPGGLFLRNPSPLGLSSLSPPVPPERRKHRSNRSRTDNIDLFSFDPLHTSDNLIPAGREMANLEVREDEGERRGGSSSLSELEELSLLDFSAPNSLGELESRNSSIDHHGQIHGNGMVETVVPPTPVNSLVGSRPPSSCGVRFFPEDVVERINGLQHKDSVSSSLSETWDELGFETQGALSTSDNYAWNRATQSVSPQNIVEEAEGKESGVDITKIESREDILKSENAHQKAKSLGPQLSLITEQTGSYDNWNPDSILKDQWNPVSLADLQLTPPDDEATGKGKATVTGVKEKFSSLSRKKAILNTLTPETSKEEDEGSQEKKGDRQMELLDFWTYSAQKGFLKSDSGTTTSYPESLDMWNMTIRDDSLSPLTTPDNLSENSGSFCGMNSNVLGVTSAESPIGFSNGGMEMWNTTIREDSSSTIASPEGPENVKDLCHTGSLDASESPTTHTRKQGEGLNAIEEESGKGKVIIETLKEEGWRGTEQNVKIVIEDIAAEDKIQGEETENKYTLSSVQSQESVIQISAFEHSEDKTSPAQGNNMWDLPIPGMVTSTSEYDNVGAGAWSLTSSPEHYACPVVDLIQLEEQSSPFIAVTKPVPMGNLGKTEYRTVISEEEQPAKQMFLFEGTSEFYHMSRSGQSSVESKYDNKSSEGSVEADWMDHSPFVMVDSSSTSQKIKTLYHSSPEEAAETKIQCDQPSPRSTANWNIVVSKKHDALGSSSHDLTNKTDQSEDGPAIESHGGSNKEENGNLEAKITETMSLSSSSGGERDTLKYSPESLHPGSRDELRSNSDGDSSSGLEMEYIIVSGTVKEAEREWHDRPDRQSKGTRKSMETFSILSYAATVLQTQAQDAHQRRQTIGATDNADTQQNQDLSTHYQASLDNTSEQQDTVSSAHATNEAAEAASHSQTQAEDSKSSIIARSVSPSLRYPVDHFLKTREEVYVHSQISMEDSDEGGQSPSAPPPCPTSLGDFQVWEGQLVKQEIPQTTSETHSPVLTNSSVSHGSSSIGTPLSESGVPADRSLGLPFSGDLMEEENDGEDQDEDTDRVQTALPKCISEAHSKGEEKEQLASPDLLSFSEKVIGGPSFQQRDTPTLKTLEKTVNYYNGHAVWAVGQDKQLTEQKIGDHDASQDLRGRCQDVTSQQPSQPASENAAYQWTGTETVSQGQTQCGYNYHHIDQRTENQSGHSNGGGTKSNSQQNTTDVYAEFTSDATTVQYRLEQADNYYEGGFNTEFSLDDPNSKNIAEIHCGDDSSSMHASGLQEFPQYEADDRSHCETDHAHYQLDGHSFYQSDVQPESEDHAQYVPEGYVHFLLSRQSQQALGPAGMTVASSEDTAEETDNREDPPSSASAGSNQRRKLAAPPMSVSLDRSEGSLLSDDALDTEDEALDTGDDLDVNIDEQDTPDEGDSLEFNTHGDSEESSLDAGAASNGAVAGRGAAAESRDSKLWRSVVIGEQEHRIDMKSIEPYKRVISHGGYYAEQNAIIVFAACFLPDSDCANYNYVMENLFLYVISTLELMVAEDYMIVYLNGATPRRRMPGFTWMKKCYQMIDRRLKKNLKMFIIVHPSWFIRTLLGITRPFISSKFSSKIKYVNSLQELGEIIPMEYVHIPPSIIKLDTDLQDTAAKADKKRNSAV